MDVMFIYQLKHTHGSFQRQLHAQLRAQLQRLFKISSVHLPDQKLAVQNTLHAFSLRTTSISSAEWLHFSIRGTRQRRMS
jgi:hypothetical protein